MDMGDPGQFADGKPSWIPHFDLNVSYPLLNIQVLQGLRLYLHPTTYLQIMIELEDNVDSGRFIQDGFPMASRQDPPHIYK